MNHVYRVIWNRSAACWQAVSETARGQSKSSKSTTTLLKPLLVAASMAVSGIAVAAPTGGAVTSGTASIGVSGSTTTINQSTAKAIINWNDFSIASGETVNFVQPDANAIALNRVVTATSSSIQGALNANGQVFIVNPNGITFGSTAQVNVGGLVASTLDISDSDFNNGTYRFSNSSNNASITNQGAISVANSGTAALIAPSIQQAGSIVNNDGSILLTAASDVTLSLTNRVLNSQTIHAGHNTATINHSAGTIQADGGKVILTAQGVNSSSTASISSAGSIRAQTLAGNDRGVIDLSADSASGTVNLTGTLDASAPTNGFGGTIRTIGADVAVSNSASVTTRKVNQTNLPGTSSYWQIKANSINVGSGGTISGSELSSSLNDGSVTLTASGTGTGQGNININDAVSTNSNVILNLAAAKDINFNNNVGLTANLGRLVMSYGSSNDYNLNNNSKITLSGAGATLRLNSTDYTIINSLGVAGDTTSTTLQGMKNNLTGNYALGSDIDASATSGWNSGKGFDPIGTYDLFVDIANSNYSLTNTPYTGQFHGLGHSISNLTINQFQNPTLQERQTQPFHMNAVGLFGSSNGLIRNTNLINGEISGFHYVGGLVGLMQGGQVKNSHTSNLSVLGESKVGGLIGYIDENNAGKISLLNTSTSGTVTGDSETGGLVGTSYGSIYDSASSAEVDSRIAIPQLGGGGAFGGLAGSVQNASIVNSHASGNVEGRVFVGGLVGSYWMREGDNTIENSYANGSIDAVSQAGGLIGVVFAEYGVNKQASLDVTDSYASGDVIATDSYGHVGGLIGDVKGTPTRVVNIINSHATGDVTASLGSSVGGLVGSLGGNIFNSHATGNITGGSSVGGLVGEISLRGDTLSTVSVDNSYATGDVNGTNFVGGLIGYNNNYNFFLNSVNKTSISNNYATGAVSGVAQVGGLIGQNYGGIITNSYSSNALSGISNTGGLIGVNQGGTVVNDSYWDTTTSGQSTSAGGTGKTTAELKQIATFSGWDIADVSNTTSNSTWVIDENNATPWLR